MPKTFRELHPYRHFIAWLLSVTVLAVVGMWLFNVIAKSEAEKANKAQAEAAQHTKSDATTLTKSIKTRLENVFSNNTNLTFERTATPVPFKADGESYYTTSGSTPAVSVQWDQSLGDEYSIYIRTQVKESLKDIMRNNLSMQPLDTANSDRLSYHNDVAICATDIIQKNTSTSSYIIACVDKATHYATVKTIAPFATIHTAAQPSQVSSATVYGQLKVTDSPVEGYQRATLATAELGSYGGAELMFYKIDNTWHFFTGSQQMLPCSEYTTLALQQAFKGTSCIDNTTSEVRPL